MANKKVDKLQICNGWYMPAKSLLPSMNLLLTIKDKFQNKERYFNIWKLHFNNT
jgi:hypothetical protein